MPKYEICYALDIVCPRGSDRDKRWIIIEADNRIDALIKYAVDRVIDSYKEYQKNKLLEVAFDIEGFSAEERVMRRWNECTHGGNVVYLKEADNMFKVKEELLAKLTESQMDEETKNSYKIVIEEIEAYSDKNMDKKIELYNKLYKKII